MAQATNASKPRRRAVQSAIKSPAKAAPPRNGALSIAALAEQLDDLQCLHASLDKADLKARERMHREEETVAKTGDRRRHEAAFQSHVLFEAVEAHANRKIFALEELILELEPKTADETLTLAAIFLEALGTFRTDYCCSSETSPTVEGKWAALERATKAIMRGLIASGASSPVFCYYATAQDLLPWDATRNAAAARAAAYGASGADAGEVQS